MDSVGANYIPFSDGTGYVEDGREIFDDEEIDDEEDAKKRDKTDKKRAKKRLRDVNKPVEGKASIMSMFGNASTKKKEAKVKLDDDDILADLLGEINPNESNVNGNSSGTAVAGPSGKLSSKPSVSDSKMKEKTEMALVKDYIASMSKVVPTRKSTVKSEMDDDVRQIDFKSHFKEFDLFSFWTDLQNVVIMIYFRYLGDARAFIEADCQ